jgi:hypothetical protein
MHAMLETFGIFTVGGTLFGFGIGVIVSYVVGKRHGLRAGRKGFPIEPTRGPQK